MISHKYVIDTTKLHKVIPKLLEKLCDETALKVELLSALGLTEREIGMILVDHIMITPQGDIVEHAPIYIENATNEWGGQPFPKLAGKE
jgi:hypothetical protein